VEVTAETLDVLFIERDVPQDAYQLGTISRNARRWREFGEGLKACQEEDPDFKRISVMQPLFHWIHARHREHLSADARQSILTQVGQTEDTLPAPEITEVAAVTTTANEITEEAAVTATATQGLDAVVTKAVTKAVATAVATLLTPEQSTKMGSKRAAVHRSKRESDTKPPENQEPPKKRARATKRVGSQGKEPPKQQRQRATNRHDLHDDLNNGYGSFLLCDSKRSKALLQYEADPSGYQVIRELQNAVSRITPDYEVAKLTQSGSDAITHAVLEASHGDISRVLFAAGTYVVGDTSPLRWFSTSGVNARLFHDQGPAIYRGVLPTDEITQACRSQVVPLPYHIPDEMNDDDLLKMEQESVHHLATRLCLNAVLCRPSRALLIELILASNGAQLSERFLHRLCDLCEIFDVNLVIDEVLTSIRCNGEIMLACSRGLSGKFTHAVIGKWPGIGVVLRIKDWKQPPLPDSRGETTIAATWGAFNLVRILNEEWKAIRDQVETNRGKTCAALKDVDTVKAACERDRGAEAQCWGEGCMIFSNVHAQTGPWSCNQDYQLTAGRYLPRVHSDRDLDLPTRTLLRCNFRAEHQGYVNGMFCAWLRTGQLTPGYKQLQHFANMITSTENFPTPWQGRDDVLGMEYPGQDNIFDGPCLRRLLEDPACTELATWVDQHKTQLFKQVRKGKKRKTNYFMMPVLQKYRQFLKNQQQYENDCLLSQPSSLEALVHVTLHDATPVALD
jgi:hypothetical protein